MFPPGYVANSFIQATRHSSKFLSLRA